MGEPFMKTNSLLRVAPYAIIALLLSFSRTDAQSMSDYCLIPPYVVQNIQPNVMLVLDNSLSMTYFAYTDGFNTTATSDDNMCTNGSLPCSAFTAPGSYPTYQYYGYFNPDYWYTYETNRFLPSAPKSGSGLPGARAKSASEWDGNFLNWLTMRRIDVLRKVLTGGKGSNGDGTGFDKLAGEPPSSSDYGTFKQITGIENYADSTQFAGTRCITFSSSGTYNFTVRSTNSCASASAGSYSVAVRVPVPVEGVLQDVATKVRFGLTFYTASSQGGKVSVSVAGTSLSSMVNQVNNTAPSTMTPLAETLWSVAGYFAQATSIPTSSPMTPGPRYASGDYTINENNDPFNYGSGGAPRYPSCGKSFVLFITDGEPCGDGNLPAGLTDYANGKSQFNCQGTNCPARSSTLPGESYSFPVSTLATSICPSGEGAGFEDLALWTHTTDLRSSTIGKSNIDKTQNLTLYPVFAFGRGSTLLRYAAINGGFEDSNGNNVPDIQSEWDRNNDGQPDTFYEASDGAELEASIKNAISNMITRVSSGTAASVLASGEGSGANLIQASFYPRRRVGDDVINWVGGIQNLWYHLDPQFARTSMREDTAMDDVLNLKQDYIMQFFFDTSSQTTKAMRTWDETGDGKTLTAITPAIAFESVRNIWEGGQTLWNRDLSADPRKIYTSIDGSTLVSFSTVNAGTLSSSMSLSDINGSGMVTDEAQDIIRWVHGEDLVKDVNPPGGDGINDFRSRTVTQGSTTRVWKLGDILNSTPKIASTIRLNHYKDLYEDKTYEEFYSTPQYKNRGTVYVGANDGMLHAFNLGLLERSWTGQGQTEKVRLTGTDLGKELWAFIPKNVLPYLKYLSDPDYCHVFTVDLTPMLFDASIGKPATCAGDYWDCARDVTTWRTILIGGMRYGGGCRNSTATCMDASGDGSKDCVNTPAPGIGYSSYFALDVTDEKNPVLLWEFSDPELGFATTGPAVVKIHAVDPVTQNTQESKNGKWFVVLGSGPTGPIDTQNHQFLGRSDQNLKLFVLELTTGALVRTIDTGIPFAFAGSLYNATHDLSWKDKGYGRYQDDAVYVPFTKRTSLTPYTWTDGGIGRIWTKEDLNPNNWVWNKVMEGVGPVTASVAKMDDSGAGNLWLYFGTGRYYYSLGSQLDDANNQRRLYGIKDPCAKRRAGTDILEYDYNCTSVVNAATLTDVTDAANAPTEGTADAEAFKGWYINLEQAGTYHYPPDASKTFGAERIITDPKASERGVVYFTSYKPYADECSLGGKTFIWAVNFNTGGSAGSLLRGKVLVQVSTGSIEQKDLSKDITEKGGRRSSSIEGEPPIGQGLSAILPPKPVKRIVQIKER